MLFPLKHAVDSIDVESTSIESTAHVQVETCLKFLGFLGYYREYIPDFTRKGKPLTDFFRVAKTNGEGHARQHTLKEGQVPSMHKISWEAGHQKALCNLLSALASPPILAYPDFTKDFVLHTKTSKDKLGVVVYQPDKDGTLRVIGYGSRTLTTAEKNYYLHAGKLEFLALNWAVCDHFYDFLFYAPSFTISTDNNPLRYIQSTAKLNAKSYRWFSKLADFNFRMRYRTGNYNVVVDALSRLPMGYQNACSEEMSSDTISAVINEMTKPLG